MSEWARCDHNNPCPVCESSSWCTIMEDGSAARCMRVESERESKGSDGSVGWIHRLDEPIPVAPERVEKRSEKMPLDAVRKLAKKAYENERASLIRGMLAEELGVTEDSLVRLRVGVGYDHDGTEYSAWPCWNSRNEVVGIVRRYSDGRKMTVKNTSTGLFYSQEREDLSGVILILEGGSDVAAATSVGLRAIGRPSNTGGVEWIKRMIRDQPAIVVGENDFSPERRGGIQSCKKDCVGCGHCFPGWWGAKRVSDILGRPMVMPPEGVKDFREYVQKEKGMWWELLRKM